MITVELLDNNAPVNYPNPCPAHQTEMRAGWEVHPSVHEDQLPHEIYVAQPQPNQAHVNVYVLTILAFERVTPPNGPAFFQVTYRACV